MMQGSAGMVLAFLAGLCFGINIVFVRAASSRIHSSTVVALSLMVGTPMLFLASLVRGDLWRLDWRGWGLYALTGFLHFVVGRSLLYYSIGLMGATSAAVSASPSIILASLLAWILLGESLSTRLAVSVVLVSIAVYLAGSKPSGLGVRGRRVVLGLAAGLSSALVFATTTLLVRYTGVSHGSPTAGTFASYGTALVIMLPYMLTRGNMLEDLSTRDKYLGFAVAAGLLVSVGQLFRYNALSLAPVAIVVVFVAMNSVYAALLSPLIGSAREKPGARHLVAAILAVTALYLAATG